MVLRRRLRDRQDPLVAGGAQRARRHGRKHLKNSYASETPVTDGERVYFYFGNAGLFVFDLSGKPVWSKPIGPFKTRNGWGTGRVAGPAPRSRSTSSTTTTSSRSSRRYDKRTGAEIWRVNRDEGTNWATPFVWENDGATEIVTSGTGKVRSYDLTGKLLWEFTGMSTHQHPDAVRRATVCCIIASGYVGDALRPAYAIRPGASGDISLKAGRDEQPVHRLVGCRRWRRTTRRRSSTATTTTRCSIAASSPATTRRPARRSTAASAIAADASGFTASPWAYNGRIFAMSEDGDTYVDSGRARVQGARQELARTR